jgi:hypothetical protein
MRENAWWGRFNLRKLQVHLDSHSRYVIYAFIAGTLLRLFFVLRADFPIHDGGMFYVMIRDLQSNNYHLPWYTSYNSANIPYLYPPLPLYLVGLVEELTSWQLLEILRIFPVVFSVLTIPAFYLLSKTILKSKEAIVFSVFVFAFIPVSFLWLIMGGGITRSLGTLFSILALWQAYILYTRQDPKFVLSTALFCGLTLLSHPEAGYFLAYSMAFFMLVVGRNRRGIRNSFLVLIGTFIVISPWLITLLSRFGMTFLQPLLESGFSRFESLLSLFFIMFTNEPFAPLLAFMAALGLLICIAEGKYFLPVWILLVFLLQARAPDQRAVTPLSMLAGIGMAEVILPIFSRAQKRNVRNVVLSIVVFSAFLYSFLSAYVAFYSIGIALPVAERQAMEWVRKMTPQDSTFLVIPYDDWIADRSSEWLAVLTGRSSIAVVQGYEWLEGFSDRIARHDELQKCSIQDAQCVEQWAETYQVTFTHVYIPKPCTIRTMPSVDGCKGLRNSLQGDARYVLIFENDGASIYERLPE